MTTIRTSKTFCFDDSKWVEIIQKQQIIDVLPSNLVRRVKNLVKITHSRNLQLNYFMCTLYFAPKTSKSIASYLRYNIYSFQLRTMIIIIIWSSFICQFLHFLVQFFLLDHGKYSVHICYSSRRFLITTATQLLC